MYIGFHEPVYYWVEGWNRRVSTRLLKLVQDIVQTRGDQWGYTGFDLK